MCDICVIIHIVCNLMIENFFEVLKEEGIQPTMSFHLFIVKYITKVIFTYLGEHDKCSKHATNINH